MRIHQNVHTRSRHFRDTSNPHLLSIVIIVTDNVDKLFQQQQQQKKLYVFGNMFTQTLKPEIAYVHMREKYAGLSSFFFHSLLAQKAIDIHI